jgi:hypothetical protein
VVPLEIEGSDKSRIHYTLIVVNNPEFSQKIVAEGINKNDFVSHMPPKWNLEDDIKMMKNIVRAELPDCPI